MGKPPTTQSVKLSKPKAKSQADECVSHVLSDDDKKALNEFCEAVPLEDITFDSWRVSLRDLHLQIPLFVCSADIQNKVKKEISFVRTIKTGNKKDKKKVVITLDLLPTYKDGEVIILKEEGDVFNENKGNLIITLKITA